MEANRKQQQKHPEKNDPAGTAPAVQPGNAAAEEARTDEASNNMITTEEVMAVNSGRNLPTGQLANDVATDTGSTIDSLDSAFHNALDINKSHAASGSNRAEFYESKSYGKSDSEEEVDALYKKNRQQPDGK
ncbi:hypothetical protein V9K67_02140 [Paraflavisolibacter sp. H34]|uniref:hypothetical protein n=1 Tax=Huijunlia imazamoxiresistens TaxID=3127457 RepID=UPI003017B45B